MTRADVALCLTDPGFDVNVLVDADLATFYRLWGGRISYAEALRTHGVRVDGLPRFVRAFPQWFGWSAASSPNHGSTPRQPDLVPA